MYKSLIRPLLFKFDPENIHHFTFSLIKGGCKIPGVSSILRMLYDKEDKDLERELMGLKFKNPVGLAAGFDKNASLYKELSNFGFGFIEVGTVTPKAQKGNPKKRLFRLLDDKGIINRMGFNNDGLEAMVKRLKNRNSNLIIGGNIGKNTGVAESQVAEDYLNCFKALQADVDYFVVNVSCPNVGPSAKLQDKHFITDLLNEMQVLNAQSPKAKPILLKIGPDLNHQQLDEIIEIVEKTKIEGVVACNTTVSREGLQASKDQLDKIGAGGLSGQPLKKKSTEVIRYLAQKSNKAFVIIGVGGIHSEEDALEKLEAGADLLQIYTGFIYEGPGLIKRINKAILNN